MTDLTEQWRKGELPCGWYYIKIADIVFIDFFEGKVWKNKKDEYIDEVLAPVPSYEEYEQLENWNRFTADYHALREGKQIAEYEKVELIETVEALKSELKEVCDVLIRKCPEMKEWVMLNWKNLYEVQDE